MTNTGSADATEHERSELKRERERESKWAVAAYDVEDIDPEEDDASARSHVNAPSHPVCGFAPRGCISGSRAALLWN